MSRQNLHTFKNLIRNMIVTLRHFRAVDYAIFCTALLCLAVALNGCKSGTTRGVKTSDATSAERPTEVASKNPNTDEKRKSETQKASSAGQSESQEIPQKAPASSSVSDRTKVEPSSKNKLDRKPSTPDSTAESKNRHNISSGTKISEVDLVKKAALVTAKGIESVKKIKICYLRNEDEWWVTLYDDLGPILDLKQYTWDRDTETLKPFLVLKRISKNRLDSELLSKVPDRTCEIMDPPPKPDQKKE